MHEFLLMRIAWMQNSWLVFRVWHQIMSSIVALDLPLYILWHCFYRSPNWNRFLLLASLLSIFLHCCHRLPWNQFLLLASFLSMFFASFHATALKSGNKHYSSTSSPSVQNGHHRRIEWLTTRKRDQKSIPKVPVFLHTGTFGVDESQWRA